VIAAAFGVMAKDIANFSSHALPPYNLLTSVASCICCGVIIQLRVSVAVPLCCAVLCCAVLCCAVLCCAVLCCAVLAGLHGTAHLCFNASHVSFVLSPSQSHRVSPITCHQSASHSARPVPLWTFKGTINNVSMTLA